MKLIRKIMGLFTCSKDDGTITLNNLLVQDDLYYFLNSDITSISMVFTTEEFQICRVIDKDSVLYYPYETKVQMEEDYLELRRVIKELK